MYTNYPLITERSTVPGVLPVNSLARPGELVNPGIHNLPRGVPSFPEFGQIHGEWLDGIQDEALSHPSIQAIAHQFSVAPELGITDKPKVLRTEGEIGWLYGYYPPSRYMIEVSSAYSHYPLSFKEEMAESAIVFGNNMIIEGRTLETMKRVYERTNNDKFTKGQLKTLGYWYPNIFRIGYPTATETILFRGKRVDQVVLAIGDSAQVAVPTSLETGNRYAARLFDSTGDSQELQDEKKLLWSAMIPNGRAVLPPGTRLYAVLAAYYLGSHEGMYALETHVFADLTDRQIDLLSQLMPPRNRVPMSRPTAQHIYPGVREDQYYSIHTQVISPVVYLGVSTVGHIRGNQTIMTSLTPVTFLYRNKVSWRERPPVVDETLQDEPSRTAIADLGRSLERLRESVREEDTKQQFVQTSTLQSFNTPILPHPHPKHKPIKPRREEQPYKAARAQNISTKKSAVTKTSSAMKTVISSLGDSTFYDEKHDYYPDDDDVYNSD